MKILHVIPSLSLKHGGPSVALPLIARCLAMKGCVVDVVTTDDDGPGGRLNVPLGERVEQGGYGVYYFPKQTEFYKVSLPLRRWLRRHIRDYDLVHVHALFSYASNAAARCAARAGVPYIIRPLGVLNQWGMANRRPLLKSLSFRFVEGPLLRRAAGMHYTSEAERVEAESAGATAPAAVVPLGIDLAPFEDLPSAEKFLERWPRARGKRIVLFLSRIDRKKGLDLLLEAWAQVQHSLVVGGQSPHSLSGDWLLVVAGKGDEAFEQELKAEAKHLGIEGNLLWAGHLDEKNKLAALAAASVFVLPSHSENFGIALVEGLAAGLPCVTTSGVAISVDVAAAEAGFVVSTKAALVADALSQVMADNKLRGRLGANAKKLVAEKFSLDAMGNRLVKLYESLLAKGAPRS